MFFSHLYTYCFLPLLIAFPHFLEFIHRATEDQVGKESAEEIGNKVLNESTTDTEVLSSLEHTIPHSTTGVCVGGEDDSKVEEDESEVEINAFTERSKPLHRGGSRESRRRASKKCPCCEIT